jgi:hypothetical protein
MNTIKSQIDNIDTQIKDKVTPLINERKIIQEKIDALNQQLDELKTEQSMIDGELQTFFDSEDLLQKPIYVGGFRMEMKPEVVGSIELTHEMEALKWALETNNEDVIKLSVGKRAFNKLLDSGKVPHFLKINTYNKFSVRKDTRKEK